VVEAVIPIEKWVDLMKVCREEIQEEETTKGLEM
jgi:hypothetical protein